MSAPTRFALDPSSREAEAKAEMAATSFAGAARATLAAGALAVLLSGPVVELAALARGTSEIFAPLVASEGSLLDRARADIAEIERRFDERSALALAVRPRLQRLLTATLRQGNERVLVGRNGWLFFADDVAHVVRRAAGNGLSGDPERAVIAFRDALAARGVALVVAPVPVKPAIHPDRLGAGAARAPLRNVAEAALLDRLRARGVELVDLAPRFSREAAREAVYLATDTHWTPDALEIAAQELALRLREVAALPPGEPERFEGGERPLVGAGDLVALLGLEPGAGKELFARESVTVRPIRPAPADGAPAGRAPVVLLGDSFAGIYSAHELGWGTGAGLPERLAARLGLPVEGVLQNAGGASATRELLARQLAADPRRLDGVRAVVWLFAAREWSQGIWRMVELP